MQGYKVYLTSDPNEPIDHWKSYHVDEGDEPTLVLERGKLDPETPYYLKIAAVGPAGEGVPSDVVAFETVSGGEQYLNVKTMKYSFKDLKNFMTIQNSLHIFC